VQKAGEFLEVGTNEIILWYALTGHRGESGILISGTTKFCSPNCIVFDHGIGKDPDAYSPHSFRRRGASWAFSAEVSSELIQLYGDWSSDAYKKYLRFKLDDKIAVAEKMRNHIF
jgi:hypothetical protein